MQPWRTCINVDQSHGNALARVSRFTSSIAVDLPSPRLLEHSYRQFMEKPPASCSVHFARSKPSRSVFWTIPEDSCKFQVFLRDVERLRGSALRGEDSERAETDLRNEPEPEPELLFCVWRNEPEPAAVPDLISGMQVACAIGVRWGARRHAMIYTGNLKPRTRPNVLAKQSSICRVVRTISSC